MSLLSGALGMGRTQAEGRFTETFDVFTTTRTLDESTGVRTTVETTVYSRVAGRFKFPPLAVAEVSQAGQVPAIQDVSVHVAVGATPLVEVNHLWRCTGSTVDVSLVGRVVRTKGLPQAGQVTAWRYPVESVA